MSNWPVTGQTMSDGILEMPAHDLYIHVRALAINSLYPLAKSSLTCFHIILHVSSMFLYNVLSA